MRTFTRTAACPNCAAQAVIILTEAIDPRRGTEGHEITFTCAGCRFQPSLSDLLKLWAANRPHPDPVG